MNIKVYKERILKKVMEGWINKGDKFILEEDQDSGYDVGQQHDLRIYKEQIGLEYFFNASGSPDLALIENIWRAQKQNINNEDHWDDPTLLAAIHRAWKAIKQATINRYIDSMMERMRSLGMRNGDITEF